MTFNLPNFLHRTTNLSDNKTIDNMFNELVSNFYRGFPNNILDDGRISLLPRLNIFEADNKYHVEAELPGINQKDVEVKLDNDILTIRGKLEESAEQKDRNYYMHERRYGSFQRSITLPRNVKESDIKANFKDGILKIEIPKDTPTSGKKIEATAE